MDEWRRAEFKEFARAKAALFGMSQAALARRIGTQPQNVCNWIRHPGGCCVRNFATMADKLGMTDEEIGYFVRKEAMK